MRHIYTLGETVLDILFRNNTPVSAIAGGSMLNTAVALGRTGCLVDFICEFGNDDPGNMIIKSLSENQVSAIHSVRYQGFNTSIALAFLDDSQNARYTFYHNQPTELPVIILPEFRDGDILAFGSFYSVRPTRRQHVSSITEKAREAGALIIFDPNVRKHHLADMPAVREIFFANMSLSNIVKGSNEDFEFLTGTSDPDGIYAVLKPFCRNLIITQGEKNVLLFTPTFRKEYVTQVISPVSTVGAGDNFTAGLIYGLVQKDITIQRLQLLTENEWDIFITSGIAFATATCLSMENYVPAGFNPNI
jgi:fructokinase